MDESGRLSHNKWKCKYRVAFIPLGREEAVWANPTTRGACGQRSWLRKLLARTRLRRIDVFSR
jgi:hypothetical protein